MFRKDFYKLIENLNILSTPEMFNRVLGAIVLINRYFFGQIVVSTRVSMSVRVSWQGIQSVMT